MIVFTESKQGNSFVSEEQLKEYKQVLTVHGENRDKLKKSLEKILMRIIKIKKMILM